MPAARTRLALLSHLCMVIGAVAECMPPAKVQATLGSTCSYAECSMPTAIDCEYICTDICCAARLGGIGCATTRSGPVMEVVEIVEVGRTCTTDADCAKGEACCPGPSPETGGQCGPVCALAAPTLTSSLQSASTHAILGGDTVDPPFSMPYVLSLYKCSLFYCELRCGASLIASRWALTAAHCTVDPDAADVAFGVSMHRHRLGDTYEHDCAETMRVRPICHPGFSIDTMANDVCLLWLDREPKCFRQMQHMVLDDGSHATVGIEATVAGWGATSFDGVETSMSSYADTLQALSPFTRTPATPTPPHRHTGGRPLCHISAGGDADRRGKQYVCRTAVRQSRVAGPRVDDVRQWRKQGRLHGRLGRRSLPPLGRGPTAARGDWDRLLGRRLWAPRYTRRLHKSLGVHRLAAGALANREDNSSPQRNTLTRPLHDCRRE